MKGVIKRFTSKLNKGAIAVAGTALLATSAFADDPTNLREALPDSFLDSSIWVVASLVIGAVVAVKAIQMVLRLVKRV